MTQRKTLLPKRKAETMTTATKTTASPAPQPSNLRKTLAEAVSDPVLNDFLVKTLTAMAMSYGYRPGNEKQDLSETMGTWTNGEAELRASYLDEGHIRIDTVDGSKVITNQQWANRLKRIKNHGGWKK